MRRPVHLQSARQGSLKRACAGQGHAPFSRVRLLATLFVHRLPCGPTDALGEYFSPLSSQGLAERLACGCHPQGVNYVFRKCNKSMVWGRREGVHSKIRALKTLYPPHHQRQYSEASSCLPRCISSEDSHSNFEHKSLSEREYREAGSSGKGTKTNASEYV